MNKTNVFNPMAFLASLGAGGIAVAFFAFLNYTIPHGKGLITFAKMHATVSGPIEILYSTFEIGMAVFIVLHLVLSAYFFIKIIPWFKTADFKEMLRNPLTNSALVTPFISLAMTMNVFIGSVRYFWPLMSDNFQAMMLPGLVAWSIMWLALLLTEIKLLKISFINGFDINKIHFGWLLHPFALGMMSVTGAGIAALSANKPIADTAAFMLLITMTMGLFLLLVKSVALFKGHFAKEGLPEKQFLPSLLIIVPNVTLYAITIFRMGHYLEHHYDAHLGSFFMIIMTTAFAFEVWYMMFGLSMLKDYVRKHLKSEFHLSQWGLICPFVALSVLGAFVYTVFSANIVLFWFIVVIIFFTSFLFLFLLTKQLACAKQRRASLSEEEIAAGVVCS